MAGEVHGSKAELKIKNAASVLTVIDGGTSASLEEAFETAEVSAFLDTSKRYIAGLADATLSFEASSTTGNAATLRGIKGLVRDFEYYPAGNVSGEEKLSGQLLITSLSRSSDLSDAVKISAEFQVTGGVTAADVV